MVGTCHCGGGVSATAGKTSETSAKLTTHVLENLDFMSSFPFARQKEAYLSRCNGLFSR